MQSALEQANFQVVRTRRVKGKESFRFEILEVLMKVLNSTRKLSFSVQGIFLAILVIYCQNEELLLLVNILWANYIGYD